MGATSDNDSTRWKELDAHGKPSREHSYHEWSGGFIRTYDTVTMAEWVAEQYREDCDWMTGIEVVRRPVLDTWEVVNQASLA